MAKTRQPVRRPRKSPPLPEPAPDLLEDVIAALPPLTQDDIRGLRERIRRLELENEKLKATLAQNFSNSNRPPLL